MKIETDTFHLPTPVAGDTPPYAEADRENEFAAFAAQLAERAERLRRGRGGDPLRPAPETLPDARPSHTAELWAGGLVLAGVAVAALLVWGWPIDPVNGSRAASGDITASDSGR